MCIFFSDLDSCFENENYLGSQPLLLPKLQHSDPT